MRKLNHRLSKFLEVIQLRRGGARIQSQTKHCRVIDGGEHLSSSILILPKETAREGTFCK